MCFLGVIISDISLVYNIKVAVYRRLIFCIVCTIYI